MRPFVKKVKGGLRVPFLLDKQSIEKDKCWKEGIVLNSCFFLINDIVKMSHVYNINLLLGHEPSQRFNFAFNILKRLMFDLIPGFFRLREVRISFANF